MMIMRKIFKSIRLVVILAFFCGGAQAATLTVTAIGDTQIGAAGCADGCSLREAIDAAAMSGDTIEFASPLFNTAQIIDINGQIIIDKSLTITGRGANLTTVRNIAANSRVLTVNGGVTVNLSGMTFTGGNINSFQNGGGIFNVGILRMTGCAVSGNSAGNGNLLRGGGIHNEGGTLTIIGSTISGNFINNALQAAGGGISNSSNATLTIANSTVSGNFVNASNVNNGGGILNTDNSTATITNSTITNNSAGNSGGGIRSSFATLRLRNSIVSGNFGGEVTVSEGTYTNFNNYIGGDARLLPLSFYGGATKTHALRPDSPAINQGNNCVLIAFSCSDSTPNIALTTDQRGISRAGQVDIGAFEYSVINLVVTNTNDNGTGSLRTAIASANLTAGDENISFSISSTDTGCANGICTITLTSGELSVSNETTTGTLTIQHPTSPAYRIAVSGNNNSRVFNVGSGANLILDNLTVTGGSVNAGNLRLGGGIFVGEGGILSLDKVTVSDNSIPAESSRGGGIYVSTSATATIINSTVSGNQLSGSSISFGGGIYINPNGTLNLTNSTVSGNSVSSSGVSAGGGIVNEGGSLMLQDSTISNNSAAGSGGGLINSGGGMTMAVNSIISGNNASASVDLSGALTTDTNNRIGDFQNVRLAPLGFYGGATETHALLSGSTAINAGTSTNAPTTDQRGAARIGNVDIGAFELNNTENGGNFVAELPKGTTGVNYNYTLVQNNGAFTYSQSGGSLPSGINLTTAVTPNAVVVLGGTATMGGIYNFAVTATDGANTNVTNYRVQFLAPTAARVSIGGRVSASDGIGIRNAIVVLTLANGETLQARTSAFGYYRFDDIEVEQTVFVSVISKRFQFVPQIVSVSEELTEMNFTAQ